MGTMGHSGAHPTSAGTQIHTGYFGKVPVHGDFVGHGLPRPVEDALDTWLRAAMRASQAQLGRGWLDAFLVTPVWHFAAPPGTFGPVSVLGVMMPSVDRVGRYFPLVIAAAFPLPMMQALHAVDGGGFYPRAEATALSILDSSLSLGQFNQAIDALPLPDADRIAAVQRKAADALRETTVWWTPGNDPHWLDGLPPPESFADVFMASAAASPPDESLPEPPPQATPQPLQANGPATAPMEELPPVPAALELRPDPQPDMPRPVAHAPLLTLTSASASLKGQRSASNTDVAVTSADGQAFTLISGLGQDPSLPAAIGSVAPLLKDISHPFAMNDLIAEAKGKLGRANATLTARAASSGQTCGASVVTLLIQAQRHAVLWAGIARAFLLRDGELVLLNRPHLDSRLRNVVTRALGAGPNLSPDTAIGQVRAGDRFLLASPGLYDATGPQEIGEVLSTATDPHQAVTHLTQNALIAGSTLDASALSVFAQTR
ncbi:type VI secretion system-associated protein TagF [Roseobacter weihaiensis]|uniref:type VI secretion system-associated protein TagF n=1 Tax=Roseobacter weihaiensis TaxID=2763262 RepID=UPI001D0A40EF|nr:type VI secretion system-associated protein TagF [Roseobacter sp. H9]